MNKEIIKKDKEIKEEIKREFKKIPKKDLDYAKYCLRWGRGRLIKFIIQYYKKEQKAWKEVNRLEKIYDTLVKSNQKDRDRITELELEVITKKQTAKEIFKEVKDNIYIILIELEKLHLDKELTKTKLIWKAEEIVKQELKRFLK